MDIPTKFLLPQKEEKIGKLSYYLFNVPPGVLVFHPFAYFCSNKNTNIMKHILFLLISLLNYCILVAQPTYQIKHYSVNDGMSQGIVQTIILSLIHI